MYKLRAPQPGDYESWLEHYGRYAGAVGDTIDATIARRVWAWILDPAHPLEARIAFDGIPIAGFMHFRPFPRTLHGNQACFLDDLWVAEDHRGSGLAEQLLAELRNIAAQRGWSHVRWVTAQDNLRAQRLYNRVARDMQLLTYWMDND